MDDELTCRCGAPSDGYHSCPYAHDIHDDDSEDYCNCCAACSNDCAMDV